MGKRSMAYININGILTNGLSYWHHSCETAGLIGCLSTNICKMPKSTFLGQLGSSILGKVLFRLFIKTYGGCK